MKKFWIFIYSTFFLSSAHATENIFIRTSSFKDVFSRITQDTALVLDLDDTLIVSSHVVARPEGRKYVRQALNDAQTNTDSTRILGAFCELHQYLNYKVIEAEVPPFIQQLQQQGNKVFGLTARGASIQGLPNFDEITYNTLKSLGIDFSQYPVFSKNFSLHESGHPCYRDGVIYTADKNKGEALIKFFELINYIPQTIAFIDDDEKNVLSVIENCSQKGINVTGIHYNKVKEPDETVARLIAREQLEYFMKHKVLLSDMEVQLQLN